MKNKGFSLVELIVVIAIMAILVGVAVPVYTSYIGKANEAKDEQLLGEINSAFMVAAVAEGVTDFTFAGTDTPDIPVLADGTVDLANMKPESLKAAMIEILGTDLKFSVIEDIWYNKNTRQFEDNAVTEFEYGDGVVRLSAEDVAKLGESAFINADGLGIQVLLNKVDYVAGFATGIDSTAYESVIYSPGYMKSVVAALGTDVSEMTPDEIETQFWIEFGTLVDAKKATMTCQHGGSAATCQSCDDAATDIVLANAAVLYAAQNSKEIGAGVLDLLTDTSDPNKNSKDRLAATLQENTGAALSQVSAAYGLYMAYAYSLPEGDARDAAIENTTDPGLLVLNGKLDEPGFQAYLKTDAAKADLEGYLSAMNMMSDSAEDNAEAVSNLLVNGFEDDDLIAIFGQAMGNN